ncbi:hypothetical protein FD755_010872 [Muntiacus reevesi]|uniref:Malic enzyme NAD-binding domain-containing protein n=1 Tax=Muntiacus reevesi TaxID=9886 RepID=A0A5N3XQW8_MUNRE|nr:hypothetical protein FD755_010872 [Muntiacus reevesi]
MSWEIKTQKAYCLTQDYMDRTHAPCLGSVESQPLDHQGSSPPPLARTPTRHIHKQGALGKSPGVSKITAVETSSAVPGVGLILSKYVQNAKVQEGVFLSLHGPARTVIALWKNIFRSQFGINCLIQFEDFANANAFRLLNKYRNKYCMFNDDIQGTASVAVAGILAALRITKNKLSNHVFVFQGAGEAAMGIAHLLVMALEKEGVPKADATRKIWMVDSKGLIVKGRSHLNHEKEMFAQDHPEVNSLEEVVRLVKPTAIIGVAAIAGAFTEQILRDMASFHKHPIIFALSNPTSKAECTAEKCYRVTEGRGIFASGSPFPSVTLEDGRTFFPGQGNNAYVFPGVALGVIAGGIRHIPDEIFLLTAEQIAQEVSEHHLSQGRLYPPLSTIRDVSLRIAIKVLDFAYKHNLASYYPEPEDKEAFVRSLVYTPDYDSFTLDSYTWPEEAMNVQNI